MASSLINWIIDKKLSSILSIDPNETKSGLWSGFVELNRIKIKPTIFQEYNLPFLELVNGYIGQIKIKMSLPRFYLYPIIVEIDKVYFHAKQKKLDNLNKKEEIEAMEAYKKKQLLSQEELRNEMLNFKKEESSEGMVSQIINNLKIIVKDICIRYDDDISCPEIPFTFGALLKELTIATTNQNFDYDPNKNETIPIGDINYKLLMLKNFSIYLDTYSNKDDMKFTNKIVESKRSEISEELSNYLKDLENFYLYCSSETDVHIKDETAHQYLLYNMSLTLKTAINDKITQNKKPKIEAECELDKVRMGIGIEQIFTSMKLMAYINLNSLYRVGISKEYYNKSLVLAEQEKYIQIFIEYYQYKWVKKNESKANQFEKILDDIHIKLTYDQIQSMRDIAYTKMSNDKSISDIEEKIKAIENTTKGWFYNSELTEDQKHQIEILNKQKEELLKQGKKDENEKIQQIIQKTNTTTEIDQLKELADTDVVYKFKFSLPNCEIDILEDKTIPMITLVNSGFNINAEMRKKGQYFSLDLDDFKVLQKKLNDTPYQSLVETKEFNDEDSEQNEVIKAFSLEFENNPNFEKSNYKLKIRNTKSILMTLNLYCIQYLSNRVLSSLKSTIDLTNVSNYVVGDVKKYIKAGFENNLLKGNYQHFNVDLDLSIKSPIMIMPQNVCDANNKNGLILRFGDIKMYSNLPERQDFTKYDYTTEENKDIMYDIYILKGEKFYLGTLENYDGDISHLSSAKVGKLIDEVTLYFEMSNLIEAKNEKLTNMIMKMGINNVKINIKDQQLPFLVDLLRGMQKVNHTLSLDLKNKKIKMLDVKPLENDKEILTELEKKKKAEETRQKLYEEQSKQIEKNIKNIKKEEVNKSNKVFFDFEFILSNVKMNILKTLSKSERIIIANSNNQLLKNEEFKEYLAFNMNSFKIGFKMTNNSNMYINLDIISICMSDNELEFTEKSPKGTPLVNQEFKKLIYSISNDSKDLPAIKENEILVDESQKPFIKIAYNYLYEKKLTEIIINMQKLKICMNLDAFKRLYQFYAYNMEYMSKTQAMLNKEIYDNIESDSESSKESNVKNEESKNDLEEEIDTKTKSKKEFESNLATSLLKLRKQRSIEVNKSKLKELKNSKNLLEHELQKYETNSCKTQNLIKEKEESKMIIKFNFDEILMDMPINEKSATTKVLRFNYNLSIQIKMKNEYESFYSKNRRTLVKMNYFTKDMIINVLISNVDFTVKLFKEGFYIDTISKDNLLSKFRMKVDLNSFIIPEEQKSVMTIDIKLEPFSLIIGFREIKDFTKFWYHLSEFLTKMYDPYDDPILTLTEDNSVMKKSINLNLIDTIDFAIESIAKKKQLEKEAKILQLKKNKEIIEKRIYNVSNFESQMDVTVVMDQFVFEFVDNTAQIIQPLLNLETSSMSVKYISNSEQGDTDNMCNLIVESISGKLIPYEQYNVLNLYQYIDANFNTQIYFYNSKVNDFEPIMEPWQGQLRLNQVSKKSRMRCDFNSDSMLNLNFTVSSIKVFNEFMKKLSQSEEEWDTELRKESKFSVSGDEIAVVFDNQAGIDISYWFKSDREDVIQFLKSGEDKDSLIKHKIKTIKPGEKQSYSRENLREKYKKYKDKEQLIMYKDKFDFGIDQYNISHNNDFSFCHTQTLILKKGFDTFNKKLIDSSNLNDSFEIDTNTKSNNNNKKKNLLLEEEEINTSQQNDTQNHLISETDISTENKGIITEKELPLSIEIKQDNLTKYVKFRSNILFYNNMDFDVDLYLVTEEDFNDKYNKSDNNIKVSENDTGLLHIEKYSSRYIPLKYLKHNCRVYCSVICEAAKQKFTLLYDNLSFLNKHLKELKDYDLELETSEDKSNIQEPKDVYSKIVPMINSNNKTTYIAVDLMVQRGINDKIIKSEKEKELEKHLIPEYNEFTYRYEFVLDESLLIENQIPYQIKLNVEGEEKKQEITLNPLKYDQIVGVDLLESTNCKIQFNLLYNDYSLYSEQQELKDLFKIKDKNDIKEILLKNDNNEKGLICKVKINNNFIDTEIFNPTRFKLIKNFTKKKHLVLYFDYIIVNTTQTDLYIKDANIKDKNDGDFTSNLSGKVFHSNVSLFSMNKDKIKVRTEKSSWSTTLSSNTIGMGGLVSLEEPFPNKEKEILLNDFSMSISVSSFFKNSTIIKFENRFLFYNKSGIDLYVKQYDPKDDNNNNKFEEVEIKDNNEPFTLSLLKTSKVNNPFLVIQLDKETHSSPFSIKNVNDFNIKIPITNSDMLSELSAKTNESGKSLYKFEHSNDKDYIILRAAINTLNSGLLYIVVFNPTFDDYYIQNESELTFKIRQKGEKEENEITLTPKTSIPFIWTNLIDSEKNIECSAIKDNTSKDDGPSFEIDFASISSKEIKLFDEVYLLQVLLQNKNHTRTLVIKRKDEKLKMKNNYLNLKRINKVSKIQMNIQMAGMGISIIDQEPKEVFYISWYGIDIHFNRFSFIKDNNPVVVQHIELLLKNFQIDYCLADSYPNIIVPKNQLVPSNEQQKLAENKGEDIVPFLHVLLSQNTVYDVETKEYTYSYPQIDYTMQETIINIEQYCLLTLLGLYNEIMSGLDFYCSKESKKKEEEDIKKPWEYDQSLTTKLDDVQKVIDKSLGANNIYINYLFLGALKFTVTLRIDLTQFETSMLFGFVVKIIATLGNSLARISKSPIRFSEMYQINVFKDTWGLISLISQHYTSQVIFQIYKILGSSDLLGNPIGFVDNIGTGFAEFFNEPRKGLVNGPLGFGQGLVKGIGGLVSHVVGGGLDVVAKISGSLLSAAKTIQGEKFFQKEEDEPSNVLSGIFDGIYGGVIDLGKGFSGLFTSPYKEAKKSGFGGFFKGLGKGFLGLIMAPVTAALRIGNSVVVGIKNTVGLLGGSKVKILGFRHPKLIEKALPLPVYKGDAAEVRVLLNKMSSKFETQKIVYFKIFKYRQPPFDSEDSYFVLTDKEVVIIYNYDELVLHFEIDKLERIEIHKEADNEYIILFFMDGDKRRYLKNYDFDLCCEVFSILNKENNH